MRRILFIACVLLSTVSVNGQAPAVRTPVSIAEAFLTRLGNGIVWKFSVYKPTGTWQVNTVVFNDQLNFE